jgi:hypothetical protein
MRQGPTNYTNYRPLASLHVISIELHTKGQDGNKVAVVAAIRGWAEVDGIPVI